MKKVLIAVFVVLIMAIAGAVYYVLSNFDAIIEAAIEEFGSKAVKTSVEVEKVQTSLTEGTAVIYGFSVANPKGFSMPQAFSLDEIAVAINLEQTDKETVAIDLVNIVAPRVYYEINEQRQGSLNIIKDNLAAGDAASGGINNLYHVTRDGWTYIHGIDVNDIHYQFQEEKQNAMAP